MSRFQKLVCFKNEAGAVFYGEANNIDHPTYDNLLGATVSVYRGQDIWDPEWKLENKQETISEVLCPLPQVPIFLCAGVNYKKHADEAGIQISPYPTIFTKPPDARAGPFEDIPINPECKCMDYECELCVIIGKDCKNVTESEDPLQYVLGYTAGNDVSSRWWQMPERSNNQHGPAKSFDKFAPFGPVISSPETVVDAQKLKMRTLVNGTERQSTNTDDMIYNIPTLIRHLSRGATIRKGTVIMTGTPSGVAAFLKPPQWLADGDVVEVEIERIGTIRNKMVFEKPAQMAQ